MAERVAVFGGSFNPPHVSHVLAVCYVLSTQPIDRVLVIPAFGHPLGKHLLPFKHRFAMCELAFRDLHRVEVSSIEEQLGGESRTIHTLEALAQAHPDWSLRLVVGADILHETHKWFAWERIVALAPPIVLGRAGYEHPDAPPAVLPAAASRDIRAALSRGESLDGWVPANVLAYAQENRLYAP